MTLRDWVGDTREEISNRGWAGARDQAYEFYVGGFRRLGHLYNYGEYVYDHEWDLLVVLDACRADLMAEVAEEYDFVDDTAAYSCASSSGEWHHKTFVEQYREETRRTALVTGNPYSETHLDPNDFTRLDEVWRYGFDTDVRSIPARAITDRTIAAARETDADRVVAHYMQPHHPFIPDPMDKGIPRNEFGHTPWDNVWHKLRRGQVDYDEVWEGYRANLRYVLDDVALLLENVDAERVLVTADHGNLLGEFGLYAHPSYVPLRPLKRVPWCETTATDDGTHDPAEWASEADDVSRDEQLSYLGYR